LATTVFTVQDITLQDDTKVTLKPLPIKKLRKFMSAWNEMGETDGSEEAGFDVLIKCAGIALETELKAKGKLDKELPAFNDEGALVDEYKEYLEETLDIETIYKVLEVTGGLKLNDPKLAEEIQRAQLAQLGKNST